ncbi:hypothetical protein KZP23_01790 [Echinicola marina]|uniref:hypothetical protein n=1 Tax=Echinicola marina TaxID=2859768 RepID=UPI001CF6F280|nr:hypothetical protein [Echinicola marina]UCS93795.1 hypothetical protein KZP23_01790 [Echinicola marina]
MDKQKHPIDALFSNKLKEHQEKPSTLAWEKLDAQLSPQKKSKRPIWISFAAMLIALFVFTILLWRSDLSQRNENTVLLTDTNPVVQEEIIPEQNLPSTEVPKQEEKVNNTSNKDNDVSKSTRTPDKNIRSVIKKAPLTAQHEQETEKHKESPLVAESKQRSFEAAPEISINKELDMVEGLGEEAPKTEELIVENSPKAIKREAVTYTVKIKSSGISEKPKKEKLVTEIGDTINTLGGLLGKVDEGYANLQDAKNNLFASLISKKEEN